MGKADRKHRERFCYDRNLTGCLQRGKRLKRVLRKHRRQRRCVEIRMTDGIEIINSQIIYEIKKTIQQIRGILK